MTNGYFYHMNKMSNYDIIKRGALMFKLQNETLDVDLWLMSAPYIYRGLVWISQHTTIQPSMQHYTTKVRKTEMDQVTNLGQNSIMGFSQKNSLLSLYKKVCICVYCWVSYLIHQVFMAHVRWYCKNCKKKKLQKNAIWCSCWY